jgi:hypothetical protein
VEADNGTVIATIPVYSPSATYKLGIGKSQYILANTTDYNITNIDTITLLVGSCPGYSSSAVKVTNI